MKNPLNIPLASLKQGENKLNFELQPHDLDLQLREVAENPSFEFIVGPVAVALAITRSGLRLMVSGSVSYRAKLECSMCACEYEWDFCEPLTAEFLSCDEEVEEPGRRRECDDQGGLHGNWLDLMPMVHDAIHLAVPIAPRCRPDCRGLCPDCGADLNQGQCGCALVAASKTVPGLP
ncbi:DUF177 domain-containing protein [candidate division WOR-3 bacterium]|uniref:DUF177 domain-containing protein n=1 Tax=candidate division WOR-3 bacterium TaxID=2052148 RepID=A0A937XDG1_UNCW3|nr:DUF177 domain-containing protein [candidate division WOR-3 bacterium]